MPKKILIVDDDPDMVYILQHAFEKEGYEVVTALDGQQALRTLKTVTPDLMMMDLTMPGISGWHLNMKVRQDERFKNTPIIILSGLLEKESTPEQFEAGTVYIPKPFEIFELIAKVKELLK